MPWAGLSLVLTLAGPRSRSPTSLNIRPFCPWSQPPLDKNSSRRRASFPTKSDGQSNRAPTMREGQRRFLMLERPLCMRSSSPLWFRGSQPVRLRFYFVKSRQWSLDARGASSPCYVEAHGRAVLFCPRLADDNNQFFLGRLQLQHLREWLQRSEKGSVDGTMKNSCE